MEMKLSDLCKVAVGIGGVVAMVVSALTYFPSRIEVEAIAGQVEQNSDHLNYQSLLRQQEYLLKQTKTPETQRRLQQVEKKIRYYDCKLFKVNC